MRSPILNSRNRDICIRFYYHAHGKDVGSLSVVVDLKDSYDAITPFSISGDQGNIWNPANVYLPASFTFIHNFRIEFSTEKLRDGFEGDVAIDDILFLQQPCDGYPSESECTFEEGLFGCGYSDDQTAEYQWEWFDILAVEEPPLNLISTSYMYAKASIPSPGQTAEFYSGIYDLNGRTHCLTFDVVLTSDNTQQLLIQAQEMEAETRHDIGSLTGDIDGSWFTLGWPLQGDLLNSPFQLVFKAVYGQSTDGVIALDNVFFSEHLDVCKENVAHPTKVRIKSSSLPTVTTISRQPQTRSNPKVSMVVGVIMAVVIAAVVLIGVLMFLKYRSSTGSLTVGNKNERLDAKPFSMDSQDTGGERNSNPQMVNHGTDQGLQA
ncbi:MAM and LDL-receptor class A domain-containing protein 1-like [Lytechinus pictus]|uniref:MAM and LDL-receptor class A domain-containing protein 1-like n=1 Tax=Lytechinus pictus TaxID=7653 RepID=UPI0030BA02AC